MDYTIKVMDPSGGSSHTYTDLPPSAILDDDVFLADGLALGWDWGDDRTRQPDPTECRFAMVGPTLDDSLDIGSCVWVEVVEAGEVVVEFGGRVTDLDVSPIRYRTHPDAGGVVVQGKRVEVVAVDYTVDPAEVSPVGIPGLFPDQGPYFPGRIDEIAFSTYLPPFFGPIPGSAPPGEPELSSLPTPTITPVGATFRASTLKALGDLENARDMILRVLAQTPRDTVDPEDCYGAVLGYAVDPTTDVLDRDSTGPRAPFLLDMLAPTALDNVFPLTFGNGPDGWGLTVDPDSAGVIPADQVELGTKWTLNKLGSPNRAAILYTPTGGTDAVRVEVDDDARGDRPVVVVEVEAPDLGTEADAAAMAPLYIPDADTNDRWQAEEFTYRPGSDPAALIPSWFPRPTGDPTTYERQACYTRTVLVEGIPAGFSPSDRTFYAGQLASVSMRFEAGEVVVGFRLRRQWVGPGSASLALTPADVLALAGGGPTVAQLDPEWTVYDYRLARGA